MRCLVFVALCLLVAVAQAGGDSRTFNFTYETRIGPIEAGSGPVHVFVPLAVNNDAQLVLAESIEASIPGAVEQEDTYGNRYWHGVLDDGQGEVIEVRITTTVKRFSSTVVAAASSRELTPAERRDMATFLGANSRVLVDHPILQPILAEVRAAAGSADPARVSRAIYDWVVDNVEYKKVGTGWGNGDTFWACNERYGNCTDFHALFISLARSENIPARFEIGFPVPSDRTAGQVGGYHCWVEFYLPETGWFPIDASEAFKQPLKREFFYGSQPQDRIHFSSGRDLQLGEAHRSGPLNYFVYPHVEVAGEVYSGPVEKSFSYQNVPAVSAIVSP